MDTKKALLVGAGSIGQVHLAKLKQRYLQVSVIEPNPDRHILSSSEDCTVIYHSSIQQLKNPQTYHLAVIANWGPDHFKTVKELSRLGIKRFIIEKPLCDSLHEASKFEKLIIEKKILMISHLQWSYSYLPELIKKYSSMEKLGSPISIVVNGGAKCLATNGIHFLGLANVIFGTKPLDSSMLIGNNEINPRSKTFMFLEGNATWRYPNSRYLSINFFNRSHNAICTLINFQFGLGIISNNEIKLYSVSDSDRKLLDKPVRTKEASTLLYVGDAFEFPDGSDGTDVIYKRIEGNLNYFDQFHLIEVTTDFLKMVEKGFQKKTFLDTSILNFFNKRKKWNIS
jgi:predicted dehydrogenase